MNIRSFTEKLTQTFGWRQERCHTFASLVIGLIHQNNVQHHALSQGFNLENTHMTSQERLKKLMTIVAVAMLWISLAGTLVASPFKKTVRFPLYSTFTRGLRWVKNNLYNPCFTAALKESLKSEG